MVSPGLSLSLPVRALDADQGLVRWTMFQIDPFRKISRPDDLRNSLHALGAGAAPPIAVGLQSLRLEVRDPANCPIGAHGSHPLSCCDYLRARNRNLGHSSPGCCR